MQHHGKQLQAQHAELDTVNSKLYGADDCWFAHLPDCLIWVEKVDALSSIHMQAVLTTVFILSQMFHFLPSYFICLINELMYSKRSSKRPTHQFKPCRVELYFIYHHDVAANDWCCWCLMLRTGQFQAATDIQKSAVLTMKCQSGKLNELDGKNSD